MENREAESKRYICLVRASSDAEGTTSTEGQLAWMKPCCDRMGMVFVDQIVLDGVTGSLPGRREDLTALLERKRQKDDFDVIVVQRLDRLTRGGSAHGFWFEHECNRVGLRLLFLGDDIPQGRYANLIKVAKYEAAQEPHTTPFMGLAFSFPSSDTARAVDYRVNRVWQDTFQDKDYADWD